MTISIFTQNWKIRFRCGKCTGLLQKDHLWWHQCEMNAYITYMLMRNCTMNDSCLSHILLTNWLSACIFLKNWKMCFIEFYQEKFVLFAWLTRVLLKLDRRAMQNHTVCSQFSLSASEWKIKFYLSIGYGLNQTAYFFQQGQFCVDFHSIKYEFDSHTTQLIKLTTRFYSHAIWQLNHLVHTNFNTNFIVYFDPTIDEYPIQS